MAEKAQIMDEKGVGRAMARISYEIIERNRGLEDVCVVGILRRGAVMAGRLAGKLRELEGKEMPCGHLDISRFRDDRPGEPAAEDKSELPFQVAGKVVILVDDVLYTGRSVRAAIDALIQRGRPKAIQLAVLVDRGHRELPIRPDYVGKNLPTSSDERVAVLFSETDGEDAVRIYGTEEIS